MPAALTIVPAPQTEKEEGAQQATSSAELRTQIQAHVEKVLQFATDPAGPATFKAFEEAIVPLVFAFGRLVVALFLCVRHERMETPPTVKINGQRFERRPPQSRRLHTFFGAVCYWRTYLRRMDNKGHEGGFHPLDAMLGLIADRFSTKVLSLAARLATKLSFAQTYLTLSWFLSEVPSTEVIEQTVLGLGRHTDEWFETAPAPANDGEVLIVQADSKGIPTATETELWRRRGKRRPNPHPESARHRGRGKRSRYGKKPRRKKGDKSKNGKMATAIVMYTLRRSPDGKLLLGPINRWTYASFAPKRHAFEVARREADKRGFTRESGKLVQIVTDGDEDLATYAKELFPEAIHTIDVMHVIEYLWKAGECVYREGSGDMKRWIEKQKERLYGGRIQEVIAELERRLEATPRTGPGNKGKRGRLETTIGYLRKRIDKMDYKKLIEMDLELGSGAAEGAVKNVIALRFDHGGMRWIKERAEALLKLRCIDINGDWDAFITFVHDRMLVETQATGRRVRLQQRTPAPLPQVRKAA